MEKEKNKEEEEWHVHKLVQTYNCSYETIYRKYGKYMDENKMIPVSAIKKVNNQ